MNFKLLKILADGRFHSGEALGQCLGVSRTSIWKHIKSLQALGIDCYSVSGKGYRLAAPIELLDQEVIEGQLGLSAQGLCSALELFSEIPSTNRYLMDKVIAGPALKNGHVCLAERQTDGRGRRGRPWVSPFGRNIYLSLYWQFQLPAAALSGLGLAVGVALLRALRELGVNDAGLKWPNDVLWRGRKLAGILLEMNGEAGGPYHVVIGVGLNIDMGDEREGVDQPLADLKMIMGQATPSRNSVAAVMLKHLLDVMCTYEKRGLAAFVAEWQRSDVYANKAVTLQCPNEMIHGQSKGIDESGALIVETESGLRRFHSGEVSLRAREAVS